MFSNVKGLILAGGKSTRMGSDKSQISYGKYNQVETLFRLLSPLVEEVYVSCRPDQIDASHLQYFNTIGDEFDFNSPSNGILTALQKHPFTSFLVVAIDLPLITEETLKTLLESRDPVKMATAYKNPETDLPEPLCAIWEYHAKEGLELQTKSGKSCPRKFLINNPTQLLDQNSENELYNANTYFDYKNIKDGTFEINM